MIYREQIKVPDIHFICGDYREYIDLMKEQKPKAKKKIDPIEKQTKGEKIVVRKIKADDVEVHIVVKGDQEASKTKLIKDFIKAWFDNCSLEENLEKLIELL